MPAGGAQMHDGPAGGEERPSAASIMKEIARRVSGGTSHSKDFQLSNFIRKNEQNQALCDRVLEMGTQHRSNRAAYFVRPGSEDEFRSTAEAYVRGGAVECDTVN